jgi:hypothetical protein
MGADEAVIRSIDKWLWPYLRSAVRRPSCDGPRHLIFCLADHFEPFRGGVTPEEAWRRVQRWVAGYPTAVDGFEDADGRPMPHTFFYPAEEYDAGCIDALSVLQRSGLGEVEVHLHHRNDTAEHLAETLRSFAQLLNSRHGLLGCDAVGMPRYGFIHGNWALGNSRPDGDWCGVADELSVLSETGCYADFTFPSAPSPTQPRMVNAIYRARDTGRPRPADGGEEARSSERGTRGDGPGRETQDSAGPAGGSAGRGLMLITGPLALDWRRRKWGLLPRIENSEISDANPATAGRLRLWARQWIHVRGRPDWIFVKTHCHGCASDSLVGGGLRNLAGMLKEQFGDGRRWLLHWVTAREMYNIVSAAEDGRTGDPGRYRDYEVVLRKN